SQIEPHGRSLPKMFEVANNFRPPSQSSFSTSFLNVVPCNSVTSAVAWPPFSSGKMLTARNPVLALTAVSVAVSRHLRLGHGGALRCRGLKIVGIRDLLGLGDRAALGIGDDLHEVVALHRIDRELQLSVLDLEFRRDRCSFALAGP